jgi:hypothetical protein
MIRTWFGERGPGGSRVERPRPAFAERRSRRPGPGLSSVQQAAPDACTRC